MASNNPTLTADFKLPSPKPPDPPDVPGDMAALTARLENLLHPSFTEDAFQDGSFAYGANGGDWQLVNSMQKVLTAANHGVLIAVAQGAINPGTGRDAFVRVFIQGPSRSYSAGVRVTQPVNNLDVPAKDKLPLTVVGFAELNEGEQATVRLEAKAVAGSQEGNVYGMKLLTVLLP